MGRVIYGLVGHSITHSLSPIVHRAAFEASGIDAEYRLFDFEPNRPDDLANFCYEVDLNGVGGFSVTTPYKQTILAYLDHYDPLAKIIGAVNTIKIESDPKRHAPVLIGYNTDSTGALEALNELTKVAGKRALVLGAGGAGRAVVYSLKEAGADVHVYNRTPDKAELLADEFDVNAIEYRLIKKSCNFDLIINTTSVGSAPLSSESLLHADQIRSGAVVMDLVTFPLRTQLLKEAAKAGAQTITGERMLLHQAADQFKIWFSRPAPLEAMEKALKKELAATLWQRKSKPPV
ncbi:MAG: shikimate dehydrogenase [Candidatus Peregrinibacteria bacterium]